MGRFFEEFGYRVVTAFFYFCIVAGGFVVAKVGFGALGWKGPAGLMAA